MNQIIIETSLSKQEQEYLLRGRILRLTDNKEVQIYPMGAERYLSSVLFGTHLLRYDIKAEIKNKDVLVIPGFGNSGFLLAEAGAKSITLVDKDPVTLSWIKAFKKYYHYREQSFPSIGELLAALTSWYPPLMSLPHHRWRNALFWVASPNSLRRVYIHYMVTLVQQALQSKTKGSFELEKSIQFYCGELSHIMKKKICFDTAFVPYLLGVKNGIEKKNDIVLFIKQLFTLVPNGAIIVNPSRRTKEFYVAGKRYFETTGYESIQAIPELQAYFTTEDKQWFRTQGLAVFHSKNTKED